MKNYNHIFVTLEIAKGLKEIGFNEPTMAYNYKDLICLDLKKDINSNSFETSNIDFSDFNNWENQISMPTWAEAEDWLISRGINFSKKYEGNDLYVYTIFFCGDEVEKGWSINNSELREKIILKAIEIIKMK